MLQTKLEKVLHAGRSVTIVLGWQVDLNAVTHRCGLPGCNTIKLSSYLVALRADMQTK